MISSTLYITQKNEMEVLHRIIKEIAAYESDEDWNYKLCSVMEELVSHIKEEPLIDFMCYEISEGKVAKGASGKLPVGQQDNNSVKESTVSYIEEIRRSYRNMQLLLVADKNISPMRYMRPSISAQALLLRPFDADTASMVMREFILAFLSERMGGGDKENSFLVETRDERIRIPYSQIYFFESSGKKVCVNTKSEAYEFYDTLDNLEKKLPEEFRRCHRGVIVNTSKITKITKDTLFLVDDFELPLSRNNKAAFKTL